MRKDSSCDRSAFQSQSAATGWPVCSRGCITPARPHWATVALLVFNRAAWLVAHCLVDLVSNSDLQFLMCIITKPSKPMPFVHATVNREQLAKER